MTSVPSKLEAAIAVVARERELAIARDTHYDAKNLVVRWKSGGHCRWLDFQPYPDGHVKVTAHATPRRYSAHVFNLARRWIPWFAPIAQEVCVQPLGILGPHLATDQLEQQIRAFLTEAENLTHAT